MNNPTEQKIIAAIRNFGATEPGYFGAVTFNFKAGRITHIREDRVHLANEFDSAERSKENLYNGNSSITR